MSSTSRRGFLKTLIAVAAAPAALARVIYAPPQPKPETPAEWMERMMKPPHVFHREYPCSFDWPEDLERNRRYYKAGVPEYWQGTAIMPDPELDAIHRKNDEARAELKRRLSSRG